MIGMRSLCLGWLQSTSSQLYVFKLSRSSKLSLSIPRKLPSKLPPACINSAVQDAVAVIVMNFQPHAQVLEKLAVHPVMRSEAGRKQFWMQDRFSEHMNLLWDCRA